MPLSFRHLPAALIALIISCAGPVLAAANASPDDERIVQFSFRGDRFLF